MRTRRPDVARRERPYRTLVTNISPRGIVTNRSRLIDLVSEIIHKVETENRLIGAQGIRDRYSPIGRPCTCRRH